ncbi:uncharacterized protein LOC123884061 isoform X2 [Trifolium pratense]|uniref:uncharacterized protein LOC123884061 isoform X2 n=1 Tax=Trifolium pratense TaxID=57577 RepID=UPI001E6959D9|nr:uncharacterized protein LOC123884061 isoform X2 [Trifolium pratense]XP_045789018.1 uncharacterized protein LOC123884061 isoform X2 [Trifolium pratense]
MVHFHVKAKMKTIASRGSNANAHNETIVMTFSPFEIQKGVTNFLKICVYFILSSGMTCVGTELVKDAAKIPKGKCSHGTKNVYHGACGLQPLERSIHIFIGDLFVIPTIDKKK